MKSPRIRSIFFLTAIFFLLPELLQAQYLKSDRVAGQRRTSAAVILAAFNRGEISRDTRARYLAYSLFDPARLPAAYQSDEIERCGTPVLEEIRSEWSSLSWETQTELTKYGMHANGTLSQPPVSLPSILQTPHFTIHYSVVPGDTNQVPVRDLDRNGIPDYIDTMASILEHVWDYETRTMNYPSPPLPDTDGRMHIYAYKITSYGTTVADSLVKDNPNTTRVEQWAYSSYIRLRNVYPDDSYGIIGNLAVTCAHEFFHAIRQGVDGYAFGWLDEATATWCEDEVYDNIDQNISYMPQWFSRPDLPLDLSNYNSDTNFLAKDHWYGSWIFIRYLSEHLGGRPTVRTLWDTVWNTPSVFTDHTIQSLQIILRDQHDTLPEVMANFAASNLLLTLPPYDYREGALYPKNIGHERINGDTTIIDSMPRLASRYYYIDPVIANDYVANFSNLGTGPVTASIVSVSSDSIPLLIPINPAAGLDETSGLLQLAIIVTSEDASGDHRYKLTFSHTNKYHISATAPIRTTGMRPFSYVVHYDGTGLVGDSTKNGLIRFTVPAGAAYMSSSNPKAVYTNGEVDIPIPSSAAAFRDSVIITVRAQPSCNVDTITLLRYSIEDPGIPVVISGPSVRTLVTSSRYVLTVIPATPWRVNLKREVVGTISSGQPYGFFWVNGKYTPLAGPDPTATSASYSYDINDQGQVPCTTLDKVGSRTQRVFTIKDTVTGAGVWGDLGHDDGGMTFAVKADDGLIVGSGINKQKQQACAWIGTASFFDTLAGSLSSEVYSINKFGSMAGEITITQNNNVHVHEAIWLNGKPMLIDQSPNEFLLNGPGGYIRINDRNEIVSSSSENDPTISHAYKWSGTKQNLGTFPGGTFSVALGIDNFGDVAGSSDGITPSKPYSLVTGCIWVGGKIVDLNCLVDLSPDDRIYQATDINDSGVIIGVLKRGLINSYYTGFIMVPDTGKPLAVEPLHRSHDFSLGVSPNPVMQGSTVVRIHFELDKADHIRLEIFDELGRQISTLAVGEYSEGAHEINFNAGADGSGTYFVRLETPQGVQSVRIAVIR